MFYLHAVTESVHGWFEECFPVLAIGTIGVLAFVALALVPGLASALLQLGLLAAALFALQFLVLATIAG